MVDISREEIGRLRELAKKARGLGAGIVSLPINQFFGLLDKAEIATAPKSTGRQISQAGDLAREMEVREWYADPACIQTRHDEDFVALLRLLDAERAKANPALLDSLDRQSSPVPSSGEEERARKVAAELISHIDAEAVEHPSGWKTVHEQITAALLSFSRERETQAAETTKIQIGEIIKEWRRPSVMQLRAGEMTAQEKRSVNAVLRSVEEDVRALPSLSREG